MKEKIILSSKTGTFNSLFQKSLQYSKLDTETKQNFKQEYENATPQKNFVPLNNFNEYLSKFARCFVHLTNFQNVDIEPPEFPIVIRHHIPALVTTFTEHHTHKYDESLIWIPRGLNFTGVTLKTYSCPLSTLVEHDTGVCLNLNPRKLSMRARPWNCELNLALYPPLYVFGKLAFRNVLLPTYLLYPRLWNRQDGAEIYSSYIATIRTKVFNAWIIDDIYENRWTADHFYYWKAVPKSEGSIPIILSHDVHFLMETRRTGRPPSSSSEVVNIKVPSLCKTQPAKRPCTKAPHHYNISFREWHAKDLEPLYDQLYFEWHKLWNIQLIRWSSIFDEMGFMKHFSMCENYIEHKGYWVNLPFTSIHERVVHALIHVLQSTMGNSTYRVLHSSFRKGFCTNGKWNDMTETSNIEVNLIETTLEITTKQILIDDSILFHIPNPLISLRFVSCGRPRESGLEFMKLVKIFDSYIWLCLLIVLLGLSLRIQGQKAGSTDHRNWRRRYNCYFKEFITNLLPLIKAFLGQGDTFFASSNGRRSLLIRGSFIAVALILSNAYKGQNVYNLVTSRKLIPYRDFRQLIHDQFTIYTEIVDPVIWMPTLISGNLTGMEVKKHSLSLMKMDTQYANLTNDPFHGVDMWTEVYRIYLDAKRINHDGVGLKYKRLEELHVLVNNTDMLPTTIDTIKAVREEVFPPYFNATMVASRAKEIDRVSSRLVRTLFTKWQKIHSLEVLKRCNKTALILPSYLCHRFAQKLSSEISEDRIYVSKQVLEEQSFHVRLQGFIKLRELKRIKGIEASGIWEFWLQIFRDSTLYIEKQAGNELKKPTMSGNISVIFLIWMEYENATPQKNFVPLNNFNEYLSKFARCFVHLTNFQNVDIEPPEFPIVIRHHIPALLITFTEHHTHKYDESLIWIPRGLNFTGVTLETYSCPFSTLVEHDTGVCLNLNPHNLSMRARPWNCELNVALYPPLYVFGKLALRNSLLPTYLLYPRVWNRQGGAEIYSDYIATIRTKVFNAWIIDGIYENQWTTDHFYYRKAVPKTVDSIRIILSHDVHFLIETRRTGRHPFSSSEVINIQVPLLCKTQPNEQPCTKAPHHFNMSFQEWHTKDLEEIYETLYFEWHKLWNIQLIGWSSIFDEIGFMKHFSMCENYIEHKGYWVNLPFTSIHERVAHALIHVLQSTMGNSTYRVLRNSFRKGFCTNGKWHEMKETSNTEVNLIQTTLEITTQQFLVDESILFHIPNPLISLRFVSCGRPRESGLEFVELVKIFDFCIWLCLLILLMGLSLLIQDKKSGFTDHVDWKTRYIRYFKECFTNLFPLIKALLEQGDTFLASSSGRRSLLIKGFFIAVALILSNAYKGQNVYNLVTSRKLIPYHYFKQLIQARFTIYTEIVNPTIWMPTLISGNLTGMEVKKHTLSLMGMDTQYANLTNEHFLGVDMWTEVYRMYLEMKRHILDRVGLKNETLKNWNVLVNSTEMLPTTIDTIKAVREELFPPYFNTTMVASRAKEIDPVSNILVRRLFTKWQKIHSFEVLKGCNKTALILPSYLCHRFAQKLSSEILEERIYVSKQVLFEQSFHVRLHGFIKLGELKRIKGIEASGIWEFWLQLFGDGTLYIEKQARNELKRPTMSGNIYVIFSILMVGLAVGTLLFLMEVLKNICSFIKYVFIVANQLIRSSLNTSFRKFKISFVGLGNRDRQPVN
ncbi:unnamed protein product [Orchesella dallaii]|uniref:Uncharacterized protein n=1 Tax=Orchesella dallaii TaxID=48710 RepID=A0ABP1RLN0_9HEXA